MVDVLPPPQTAFYRGETEAQGHGGASGPAAPRTQTRLRVPGASACPLPDRTSSQARPLSGPGPGQASFGCILFFFFGLFFFKRSETSKAAGSQGGLDRGGSEPALGGGSSRAGEGQRGGAVPPHSPLPTPHSRLWGGRQRQAALERRWADGSGLTRVPCSWAGSMVDSSWT